MPEDHANESRNIGRNATHYTNIEGDGERFQEAGKDCVRDFMNNQIDISTEVVDDLQILSTFFPPVGPGKSTLFSKFHNWKEVQLIRSFVKI